MNDDYNNLIEPIDSEPDSNHITAYSEPETLNIETNNLEEMVEDTYKHLDRHKSENKTTHKNPYKKWYVQVAVFAIILTFVSGFTFGAGYLTASYYGSTLPGARQTEEPALVTDLDTNDDINVTQVQSIITNNQSGSPITTIAREVSPAIVTIATYTGDRPSSPFDYFNYSGGTGSGIVFEATEDELLIVTNYHVIEGAANMEVIFNDGFTVEAKSLGYNSRMDVAVISIPIEEANDHMDKIVLATFGDSDEIEIGQLAIAIGNPLGAEYETTVTAGIISALGRDIFIDRNTAQANLIQTDAAINPGNSGGALLNDKGEVVGINSAKYVAESVEGIGFAIPINDAIETIDEILESEEAVDVGYELDNERAFLGVQISNITSEVFNETGMRFGVYITGVFEGSGAEEAGIIAGDIIYNIDGERVQNVQELFNILENAQVGDTLEIGLVRGQELLTVSAPLYSYEQVTGGNE
jgi:serine protease Do